MLVDVPKTPVRSICNIIPGDVIEFKYYGLAHEAVVVKVEQAENVNTRLVHYNYNGLFGTRTIVEEAFSFNFLSDVYIHDYSENKVSVYEPAEVVRRARSRVGEQKFNMFTNRSSHVARWCKVRR